MTRLMTTFAVSLSATALLVACAQEPNPIVPPPQPVLTSNVVNTETSAATIVQPLNGGPAIVTSETDPNSAASAASSVISPSDLNGKAQNITIQEQQTTSETIETKKVTPVPVKRRRQ